MLVAIAARAALAAGRPLGPRLDPTFGSGRGFVTTPIPGTSTLAYGVIAMTGGDVVIAGQASPPSGNGQVVVVRYLPSGRLDAGFGKGGIFKSAFPVADAPFVATAVAPEGRTGKLVVAGGYGEGSMLVMRLTARGQLDPTFGANRRGYATINVGGTASSLAIQPNGGILLGGSNANRMGRPFVVARFTRNGVLDRAFGRRGVAQVLFWNASAASGAALDVAATRDGGVLASGHIDYIGGTGQGTGGHGSAGVFRLTRTGRRFRGFGSAGHVQVTFFSRGVPQSWYPCAMAVDRRGRIIVTGGGQKAALLTARLTPQGALDRSYGGAGNGRAVTPGLSGNAVTICGAGLSPTGVLTVGLQSRLAQLLPNGSPNSGFAPRGVFRVVKPRQVFVSGISVSGASRVVVAGSAGNALYVGRYLLPAGA